MIAYFDTSGLIPLLVEEPGSVRAGRIWDAAEHVTSVRLIYAEARAALAQAARMGRVAPSDLTVLTDSLEDLYAQLDLLDVDDLLVRRAGELAQRDARRGYDAVHLAAAERVHSDTSVLVAGGLDLCTAAGALGIAVASTVGDEG
jgi:uncharacterized protein